MSGHDQFSYHQSEKKSVVVGAPYVLCVFIIGIICLGVGTFITTHALEDSSSDNYFIIVGAVLLGVGGLLLLGTVIMCIVACCKNSQLQEAFSDDFLNVGSSTFYGGRSFAYLVNEDQSNSTQQLHRLSDGVTNLGGPPSNANPQAEAVIFLANTVAVERNRQRKYSRRYLENGTPINGTEVCNCNEPSCDRPHQLPDQNQVIREQIINGSRSHLNQIGPEKLRRVDPYPELAEDFDLGHGPSLRVRDRSASVFSRQQHSTIAPGPERLRRNVTYSAASRARIVSKRQNDLLKQQQLQGSPLDVAPSASPKWRKGSLQRRGKEKRDVAGTPESIKIHQLPRFDPDVLHALGITPVTKDQLESDNNSDPARVPVINDHGQDSSTVHMFPAKGHGSLRHPRRRPSMAMGVRGLNSQQPSGSAYRHRSSIYASDMSLHRGRDVALTLEESIAEDVSKHPNEGSVSQGERGVRTSASFTIGSNVESDIPSRGSKKKTNWSSSSSSSSLHRKEENQHSTPPRSSTSSSCSCNSGRCSDASCAECHLDNHAKTCDKEEHTTGSSKAEGENLV